MRKIISNTTPILSLLKINKLDLLKDLYGKISVPNAVFREIEEGKEKPYYRDLSLLDWIEIEFIKNTDSRSYLIDLDDGEAEAIILAREQNANLIIMDEIMGRRYANRFEITLTGTVGVLLKAKEIGFISSVSDLLEELTQKRDLAKSKTIVKSKKNGKRRINN
jgi:predicted nucleic acid-binding protein